MKAALTNQRFEFLLRWAVDKGCAGEVNEEGWRWNNNDLLDRLTHVLSDNQDNLPTVETSSECRREGDEDPEDPLMVEGKDVAEGEAKSEENDAKNDNDDGDSGEEEEDSQESDTDVDEDGSSEEEEDDEEAKRGAREFTTHEMKWELIEGVRDRHEQQNDSTLPRLIGFPTRQASALEHFSHLMPSIASDLALHTSNDLKVGGCRVILSQALCLMCVCFCLEPRRQFHQGFH